MSASWACSGLAALLLAGCGGEAPLAATGFEPGTGMQDAADRTTSGSVGAVPTWRVTGEMPVSFTVALRNDGDREVRVTGVRREPDGDDQQFVPERVDPPLTLAAGDSGSLTVHGRAVCEERYGGQITGKNGQTFVLGDGATQNVDFRAYVEFVPCR